ncbi:O-methyltransferase [Kibdelosporangium banguiense]|uniref:O-methyltransferase n=1 Tax=Kibdelosporangium banguiense TaxID=1365924 RepID=A0ABS4TXL0_9PSEU|nr:O-methyltransferase [Kibdelosporangium banguiense]MBP2329140.1 O-methyltransferase [Kibdelosporangium banguiense]
MANQTMVDENLLDYIRDISPPVDEILTELRELTMELPGGRLMLLMPGQGDLLAILARLLDARRILEIGTYTGYSTLCMARALPPDGRVVTCDINPKWPNIGREFWNRAEVGDRVEVRIGDAAQTLRDLLAEQAEPFDLVFVDADKAGYRNYFENALPLVRPGGLIVFDNVLFFGRVVDPACQDRDTAGIRKINELLRTDDRVEVCVLPVADGMTIARKRTDTVQP